MEKGPGHLGVEGQVVQHDEQLQADADTDTLKQST